MGGNFNVTRLNFQSRYFSADQIFNDLFNASRMDDTLIYRGICRDNEIYPRITRVWDGSGYKNMYRKEISMLKDFRKFSAMLIDGQYGPIDFVSCAQHFGIPTRLIDWTTDPFVALFFALAEEPPIDDISNFSHRILVCNKRYQIVLADCAYLQTHDDLTRYIGDQLVLVYDRFINSIGNPDQLRKICDKLRVKVPNSSLNNFVVLEPNRSNPRLTAQKGLFVIPKSRDKQKIESEYKAAGVRTITIDKQIRDDVLKGLANMGYSRLQLFFDLQNIAKYVKDEAMK